MNFSRISKDFQGFFKDSKDFFRFILDFKV